LSVDRFIRSAVEHYAGLGDKIKEDLQKWVYQLRIEASVEVVQLADAEISMETYERTMLMEDRARMVLNMSLSDGRYSVDVRLA